MFKIFTSITIAISALFSFNYSYAEQKPEQLALKTQIIVKEEPVGFFKQTVNSLIDLPVKIVDGVVEIVKVPFKFIGEVLAIPIVIGGVIYFVYILVTPGGMGSW